jgi:hypothetical protein
MTQRDFNQIKGLSPDFPMLGIREIDHIEPGIFTIEQGPNLPICAPIWERAGNEAMSHTWFLSDPNQGGRARPGENPLSRAGKTDDFHHRR